MTEKELTHEQRILDMLNIDEITPEKNMIKRIEKYFDSPHFMHYGFSMSGQNWIIKWKIELYEEWRKICAENSIVPS